MNAKEARAIATEKNFSDDNKNINAIVKLIETAAKDGKFSTPIEGSINETIKTFFEDLGFIVLFRTVGVNEQSWEISW